MLRALAVCFLAHDLSTEERQGKIIDNEADIEESDVSKSQIDENASSSSYKINLLLLYDLYCMPFY